MSAVEYTTADAILRVDDEFLELFVRSTLGSFRFPLRWAGITVERRKNAVSRVRVGLLPADSEPFVGSGVLMTGSTSNFEIPTDAEPDFLAFVAEAARRGGKA